MDVRDYPGLKEMAETCGPNGFDFIIDDCVHAPLIQQKVFKVLWPHVQPGGIYFMEDIGRSYMNGVCRDPSRKKFGIDYYMDAMLHKMVPHPEDRDWDTSIAFMHFYPHVCIIGKKEDDSSKE